MWKRSDQSTTASVRLGAGVTAVLLAAGAFVGACSSTSESAAVRSVVEDYLDDVGEQDYKAACGRLADALKGSDCPATLTQRYSGLAQQVRDDLDDAAVTGETINGSTATVRDADLKVETTTRTVVRSGSKKKKKTKTQTKKSYSPLTDVTSGDGFTLTKVGGKWKISAGV